MRWLRWPLRILAICIAIVFAYLVASLVGAVLPAGRTASAADQGRGETIYLLTTLLHADFAIPVDDSLRKQFAPLETTAGLPISNPDLKFLVFGWGSRSFYTTARTYADIRPGPTVKAIIGDRSVLHVVPAGDITKLENAYRVDLPPGGIDALVGFIKRSFSGSAEAPQYLEGAGYGFGDAFFEADRAFNILSPCNIWAAEGLRAAGLNTGVWTPTTHSLLLGLRFHAAGAVGDSGG